jgi:hypothetical protein
MPHLGFESGDGRGSVVASPLWPKERPSNTAPLAASETLHFVIGMKHSVEGMWCNAWLRLV